MKRLEDLNYYELLNIEEKATEKEIKDAYMSSILHTTPIQSPPTDFSLTKKRY